MKKLINDDSSLVTDALAGFASTHQDLVEVAIEERLVIDKTAKPASQVALISGGGSGHEPLHAGFVGPGMLSAACCGQIFTSPSAEQILQATQMVCGPQGGLYIVKNYTGDVLNFELGAEFVAAEGLETKTVVVADDVAVTNSTYTAGRRGVAGTLFVEKIAGALARTKASLDSVADIATQVADNVRSMGLALSACTVPHVGKPSFELAEDEIELGIGIHGEPGRERQKIAQASELAARLVEPILADLDFTTAPVLVLTNGMGATPLLELYGMHNEVRKLLASQGVQVVRELVGNYVTSLDMAGCSVTLLRADEQLLQLWDAPVHTANLRWGE